MTPEAVPSDVQDAVTARVPVPRLRRHWPDAPPFLDMPAGLGPDGKLAWAVVVDVLKKHELCWTGGCPAFRNPTDFGDVDKYGEGSVLVVVYDGGLVREAFEPRHHDQAPLEELQEALGAQGLFADVCTHWYAAIYPRGAAT